MNREEVERELARFAGTFPNKLTVDQKKMAAKDFGRFRAATVAAAIAENARRFEWPNYPELLKACEEAEREVDLRSRVAVPHQSFADVARNTIPQLARVKSDVEVILRKHRQWWHQCGQSDGYRRGIGSSCRGQVLAALADAEAPPGSRALSAAEIADLTARAEGLANTIFEDPEHFRRVLDDLRGDLAVPAGAFE